MPWTTLCPLSALTEGKAIYIDTGPLQLAVYLHNGQPKVLNNYCPHAGGSMAGGYIEDNCAVCPWHNWPFNLDTGHLKSTPAVSIPTYPARIEHLNNTPTVQAHLPDK